MDKDLLRIVIIAIGALVIVAMLLWNYLHAKRNRQELNFYNDRDPLENIDASLIIKHTDDDFEIVPLGSVNDENEVADLRQEIPAAQDKPGRTAEHTIHANEMPSLIQLSVAAKQGSEFNGQELHKVFAAAGLKYGSVKVFERLDSERRVDYAVASMIEPGLFPDAKLEAFSCPGVVFFMQPKVVENPVAVFEDLINTLHQISTCLGGEELDQNHQPLTVDSIEAMRQSLSLN